MDIGNNAFDTCDDLAEVVIGEGVSIIGHRAFYHCKNLKRVTLPSSIEEIKKEAFNDNPVDIIMQSHEQFDNFNTAGRFGSNATFVQKE